MDNKKRMMIIIFRNWNKLLEMRGVLIRDLNCQF